MRATSGAVCAALGLLGFASIRADGQVGSSMN